jgi:cytochrome c oxidase subunit 3/cytochrome c oxidase subunit I+III
MTATAIRAARPNGWWGMAVFVATEATLFGTLIGTWIYLRFENTHWPPPPLAPPPVFVPALLTAALLTTSVLMQLAWRSGSAWRRERAWLLIAAAFAVQLGYLVWALHDYAHTIDAYPPRETAFSSVYVTLLGVEHAHVLVGLLLEAWLLVRIATKLTRYRLVGLQATTFYVHAVNAITVVVLLLTIAPSL